MTDLRVWAPLAKSLNLLTGQQRHPMQASDHGWWQLSTDRVNHGDDYQFVIDDGEPLPDPRSSWQPHGVHGASRWVDHSQFAWTDSQWQPPVWSSAIVYELHIGTFTEAGTFDAAVERLDHLASLGITHVEVMPVAAFSGSHGWGYDGVALYAPHQPYGGPDGMKRFVDACHQRGLAVIMDVVYNHLGPSGNYLGQFGPYFTQKYSTPWGEAVNVDDADSGEVRRFFIDNALMWLRDYHCDGLRLDAIHAIVDESAVHLLEQMAAETEALSDRLGRPLVLIAESNLNNPRLVQPREQNGYGLHSQWSDDFHHALHTLMTGESDGYYSDFGSLQDLAKVLREGFVYDGRYSDYRRRTHGRPGSHLPPETFVVAIQNHDQIGNRAVGERLHHLAGDQKTRIAAAIMLMAPYVPMLFQGEEWAAGSPFQYFTDHQDPALGEAVRNGRQHEFSAFGWKPTDVPDPQDPDTFTRSKLDWRELDDTAHQSMLGWYRKLIELRHTTPEIIAGRLQDSVVEVDENRQWLVYGRGPLTLVANLADQSQSIVSERLESARLQLTSAPGIEQKTQQITMPPCSVAVLLNQTFKR